MQNQTIQDAVLSDGDFLPLYRVCQGLSIDDLTECCLAETRELPPSLLAAHPEGEAGGMPAFPSENRLPPHTKEKMDRIAKQTQVVVLQVLREKQVNVLYEQLVAKYRPSSAIRSFPSAEVQTIVWPQLLEAWRSGELQTAKQSSRHLLALLQVMPLRVQSTGIREIMRFDETGASQLPPADLRVVDVYATQWRGQVASFCKYRRHLARMTRRGGRIADGDAGEDGETDEEEEEGDDERETDRVLSQLPTEALQPCEDRASAVQWCTWLQSLVQVGSERRKGTTAAATGEAELVGSRAVSSRSHAASPLPTRRLFYHSFQLAPKSFTRPNTRCHTLCPRLTEREVEEFTSRLHYHHLPRIYPESDVAAALLTTRQSAGVNDDQGGASATGSCMVLPMVSSLYCSADPAAVVAVPYQWSVLHIQLGEEAFTQCLQCNFCECRINTVFYNAVDFTTRFRRSSITLDRCPGFDMCLPCLLFYMKQAAVKMLRACRVSYSQLAASGSRRRRRYGRRPYCSFSSGEYTTVSVTSSYWVRGDDALHGSLEDEGGRAQQRLQSNGPEEERREGSRNGGHHSNDSDEEEGLVTVYLSIKLRPASLLPVVFAWDPSVKPPQATAATMENDDQHPEVDDGSDEDDLAAAVLRPMSSTELEWLYQHAMPRLPFGGATITKERTNNTTKGAQNEEGEGGSDDADGGVCAVCLDPLRAPASPTSAAASSLTSPPPPPPRPITVLVSDPSVVITTACGHHFHRECFAVLQEECYHNKVPCPLCRRDTTTTSNHRQTAGSDKKSSPAGVTTTGAKTAHQRKQEEEAVRYRVRLTAPARWLQPSLSSSSEEGRVLQVMVMTSWSADGILYNPTQCASAAMMYVCKQPPFHSRGTLPSSTPS